MKKRISLTLIFISSVFFWSQVKAQVWIQQTSGTTASLNAVQFLDANNGYAAGTNGTVIKTTNGGVSWSPVNISTSNPVQEISFINTQDGWAAVGDNGANWQTSGSVWKTSNGGTSWVQQTFTGSVFAGFSVKFVNANTGWVGTAHEMSGGKNIYSTINAGTSWTSNPSPADWLWTFGLDFLDPNNGWAVSNNQTNGVIFHTSNGGPNWLPQTAANLPFMYGIDFINSNIGFAVGNSGTIKATTNGGTLWSNQTSSTTVQLNEVSFASATSGWVVGATGKILFTANGGNTWLSETSGTSLDLYDVSSLDSITAWAVGDGGVILKRTLATGLSDYQTDNRASVFPNPFSSSAIIRLSKNVSACTINLFDYTGRKVKTQLINGGNEFLLTRDGLPNGIYFYRLEENGGVVASGKVIVE